MSFNPVDAKQFEDTMKVHGFTRIVVGAEVVYERTNHNDPRLVVRVYTTIPANPSPTNPTKTTKVRAKGEDAIRTCLVFKEHAKSWGLKAAPRVYRTGASPAIFSRTLQRAREMYRKANEMAASPSCKVCGATTYPDSGRCIRAKEHTDFAHDNQFGSRSAQRGMWKDAILAGEVHHVVPQGHSPVPAPKPKMQAAPKTQKTGLDAQWDALQEAIANMDVNCK